MEGEDKETKITSVEKERVTDPRRVEQGKRLAGISREAKKRKARAEQQREQREAESLSPYVFVIPAVGIAVGGYYLLYLCRSGEKEKDRPKERENQREGEPRKKPNLKKLKIKRK